MGSPKEIAINACLCLEKGFLNTLYQRIIGFNPNGVKDLNLPLALVLKQEHAQEGPGKSSKKL
jgi:hypothetical protein